MKTWQRKHIAHLGLALSLICSIVAGPISAEESPESIALFDGESLEGWAIHHVAPEGEEEEAAVDALWTVEDGVLRTAGAPFGYIHTEEAFESYTLVIEWRWPEGVTPTNSGVLLRIADDPVTFLTRCVEAQLAHGNVGDIWAFYGASVAGNPDRFTEVREHEALGDFDGVRKILDAENAPGEWNTYEITLDGEGLTLHLNGDLVNEASGLDVLAGPIGLQSEGGPIEFRKIELTPIP